MTSTSTCGAARVPTGDEGGAAARGESPVGAGAGPGVAPGQSSRWGIVRSELGRHLRVARSLWRDFTGESAYDRYVARHEREHPDHAPMTERQFWRARAEFDEENVSTGCC